MLYNKKLCYIVHNLPDEGVESSWVACRPWGAAFDVDLGKDEPRSGYMSSFYIFGAVGARTRN